MQKLKSKRQITNVSWLRLETWMRWLKSRGSTELKERRGTLLSFLEYVLRRVLDLQPGLEPSSASIYSDKSKPQEHFINLLLAKSFSQLPLLPCVFVIFVTKTKGYFWAVCLKVLNTSEESEGGTQPQRLVCPAEHKFHICFLCSSFNSAWRKLSLCSILCRLNWFGISHSHRSGPLHILINCN